MGRVYSVDRLVPVFMKTLVRKFARRGRLPTMRIISCREVSRFVYEVVIESEKYGRMKRNVLVLPESLINPPAESP